MSRSPDDLTDVILIEQDQFVHHGRATYRRDTVWEHAILPYESPEPRPGRASTVSAVHGTTFTYSVMTPSKADYVVFATGTYPFPAKYSSYRSSVAKARLRATPREPLACPRSIMIGSGTVGRLTGELVMPSQVGHHVGPRTRSWAPGYTDALRNEIGERLATLGVRIVTGSGWPTCLLQTSATSRTSW